MDADIARMERDLACMNKRNAQFILLSLVCSIFAVLEVHGMPFSFAGNATYYNGYNRQTKNFQFNGIVEDGSWRITIYSEGHRREFGDQEYGFVGTNQFFLEYVNTDPYQDAVKETNSIFINGAVSPRSIPASLMSYVQIYWLAFDLCLNETNPPLSLPGKLFAGDQNTVPFPVNCTIDPASKLIDSIDFLNSGVIHGMSGAHPEPPPYNNGFVAASFRIKNRKQFDGNLVPVDFELHAFLPVENGTSSNELTTLYLIKAHVAILGEVSGKPSEIPVPPAGQQMVVKDYRLAQESGVHEALYVTSDGFAAPGGSLFKRRLAELAPQSRYRASNNRIGRYILIGMVIATAAMMLFLLRRNKKQNRD